MEKMIAYCGLDCLQCKAYKATQAGDMPALAKVAKAWSVSGEVPFTTEDMLCDGCTPESERIFSWCAQCPIQVCAMDRGLENCAHCEDYGCDNLKERFKASPQAKKNLEEIRADM